MVLIILFLSVAYLFQISYQLAPVLIPMAMAGQMFSLILLHLRLVRLVRDRFHIIHFTCTL